MTSISNNVAYYVINPRTTYDKLGNSIFGSNLLKTIEDKTGSNNLQEKKEFIKQFGDLDNDSFITNEEAYIAKDIINSAQYFLGIIPKNSLKLISPLSDFMPVSFNSEKAKQNLMDYLHKHPFR